MIAVRRGSLRKTLVRSMRVAGAMASTTLAVAAMIPGWGTSSTHASPGSMALNGTYRATSDGNWAKLNHQFHDQETITSTWTITSTCTSNFECTGQVASDQGWSAPLRLSFGLWLLSRDVQDWERCPDGSAFPGHQHFKFYRVDDNNLKGWDETTGPSGACGANQWLLIEMPFTLAKTG